MRLSRRGAPVYGALIPLPRWQLLLTCEHARAAVPARLRRLFPPGPQLWASHRAYDAGALELAQALAARLGAPLLAGQVSRLLVDLNRSPTHPQLHARPVRALARPQRTALLERYYWPHRRAVTAAVQQLLRTGRPVLHLAVHSFTPVRAGLRRRADLGLLYDPQRAQERAAVAALLAALQPRLPRLRLRRNSPYRGTADGLPTHLRRVFADGAYAGIELEVNQRLVRGPGPRWPRLCQDIVAALASVWLLPTPRRRQTPMR